MTTPYREELLASAARTAALTVPLINQAGHEHLLLVLDVTVDAALGVLTLSIDVKGENAADEQIWLAASTVAAVGVFSYLFSPGLIAADFNGTEGVSFPVPANSEFVIAVADTDSFTYSLEAHWF